MCLARKFRINANEGKPFKVKCKAEIAGELWATSHSQVSFVKLDMLVFEFDETDNVVKRKANNI